MVESALGPHRPARRDVARSSPSCTCRSHPRRSSPSTRAGSWPGRHPASRSTGSARRSPTRPSRGHSSTRSWPRSAAVAIALVLGTLAAMAVQRYSFFGRHSINFLLVLPIALAGRDHRHRPEHDVPDVRDRVRPDDDRHRPRDVLHRHRLQQRHRPPAPPSAVAGGGIRRPGRRHLDHVPQASPCPACGPRCCPAGCLPSRCRSTRSSSRCSRPARGRRRSPSGSFPRCSGRPSCRWSTSSRSC